MVMRPAFRLVERPVAALWAAPLLGIMLPLGWAADDPARVVCPCIADTSALVGEGKTCDVNLGGASELVLHSYGAFALFKFDLEPAADLEISKATLRVRRVSTLLVRAGLSTVATDWQEGTSAAPEPQEGGACYAAAAWSAKRQDLRPWAGPGSALSDATFASGSSRWVQTVPRFDKESFWYEIDVPPEFVEAIARGWQPGGLCLSDDFGRDENEVVLWSRESPHPPELVLEGRRTARAPSAPPTNLRPYRDALGLDWLAFEAPQAQGCEVYVSRSTIESEADLAAARKLPQWALPSPGPGVRKTLLSQSRTGEHHFAAVRVAEHLGDWSPLVSVRLPAVEVPTVEFHAAELPRFDLPDPITGPFTVDEGPALSQDGRWIRSAAKTWWDPLHGPITLEAGRNEFVAFQVVLAGGPGRYRVTLTDWQSPGTAKPAPQTHASREHYVRVAQGTEKYAPDGLRPLELGQDLDLDLLSPGAATAPAAREVRSNVVQTIWIELYVPQGAARGVWRRRLLVLHDGVARLDVPVELNVLNVELPNATRCKVSLMTLGSPALAAGVDDSSDAAWQLLEQYQRLAHEHRATLCVIPYDPLGRVKPGYAPDVLIADGTLRFDWSEWDRRFGPYFAGTAFNGLPRDGTPLDHFILPFHENWPAPADFRRAPANARLADKYHYLPTATDRPTERSGHIGRQINPPRDSYLVWPIEQAIPDEYAQETRSGLRQFAEHLHSAAWTDTQFQLFLRNGLLRSGGSSWWELGEPLTLDDHLALRYWLRLSRAELGRESKPLALRAGLADPRLARDTLAGLPDLTVVPSIPSGTDRLLLLYPERFGHLWSAAPHLPPEYGWGTVYKWAWGARLSNAAGLVVPESLGSDEAWDKAAREALLYPGGRFNLPGALPSLRLKALLRVQQDFDWLELWLDREARQTGQPEGPALSAVAAALIAKSEARPPREPSWMPAVEFPGRLDTVAFEEVRRGLRRAVAQYEGQ